MTIDDVQQYRDGGTIAVTIGGREFCLDGRSHTTTRGALFEGHPSKGIPAKPEDVRMVTDAIGELLRFGHACRRRGAVWDEYNHGVILP